ncbi:MAG TPA: cation diffusion facilitator family transporter [Bacteroidales bacterium]|nr:cation diffusion facilitator family transporter [Bacteroidales bacterium]
MSAGGSKRAVIFALGGNLLIATIKYIVSFVTGSAAMLAESIHSTADSMNQVFLLIGDKRAKKQPDEWHSFGYSKEIFFWSMMVAVLLFFVGALFSIYEGINKLAHHEQVENAVWIFIVIGSSIIIEAKSFHVAYTEFRKTHKQPILRAIRESTDVNLVVILLEDFAALVGLIIVLLSTGLALLAHPVFDAIGSVMVGLLLLIISIVLINEVKNLIIGESIPREQRNQIRQIIHSHKEVKHINRMQTMVMGNHRYMVLLSLDIDNDLSGYKTEDLIEKMKTEIRHKSKGIENIYIEVKDSVRNQ